MKNDQSVKVLQQKEKTLIDRYNGKLDATIKAIEDKDHKLAALYALKGLSELKVNDEILNVVMDTKKTIEEQLAAKPYSDNQLNAIDQIFKLINND